MDQKSFEALQEKNPLLAFEYLTASQKTCPRPQLPLPQKETRVLYVVGVGEPSWQRALLEWLSQEEGRQVFFLIPSPANLFYLSTELLTHRKVKLHSFSALSSLEMTLERWEVMGEDKERVYRTLLEKEMALSLYQEYGLGELTNLFDNLSVPAMSETQLKGAFQKVPAVICGAAPSLNGEMKNLKEWAGRGLIFGVGSALAPLTEQGIPLHFGVMIDPDPPLKRFLRQSAFDLPLIYQGQVSSQILSSHQGPKIWFGAGGAFPLEEWLLEGRERVEPGWNGVTFAAHVALLMGCDPLIFVGVDLCLGEMGEYVAGVAADEERFAPIPAMDRDGKEVKTTADFLMAKEWLEGFAASHQETRFIQGSRGGLPLQGFQSQNLDLSFPQKDYDSMVHQACILGDELKSGMKKLNALDQSLRKTGELIENYLSFLKEKKNPLLIEIELEEEPFYSYHLIPMWEIWKSHLQTEEIIATMEDPETEKKVQKLLFFQEVTSKFCHARNL
ncbi:MAG: DUF115 domain-containing protein [Chlamydiia bacterium]|nr:DUF115 domain-containing protein [Chlamydiia bacterium]